jgi:hypothetical protein
MMKNAGFRFVVAVAGILIFQSCATDGSRRPAEAADAGMSALRPLQETFAMFQNNEPQIGLGFVEGHDPQEQACAGQISDNVNSLRAHNPGFNSVLKAAGVRAIRAQVINVDVGYYDPKFLSVPFIAGETLVINAVMGSENTRNLDGTHTGSQMDFYHHPCVGPSDEKVMHARLVRTKPFTSEDFWTADSE